MTEYEQGALMAVSILMATHDQPVMAADDADVSYFDEYDKRNLRRVQGELGGHICLRGL
jgi:hypothetical protein